MQYVCGQMSRAAQKRNPGRGSQRLRRALGGTRFLLAAAPTAPPCFCRWQRSSLLHRGFFTRRTIRRVDAVRIHPCSPFCKTDKTETPVPIGYRSSWWARVDYASRAAKNSPLGCFYAVFCDSATVVRIHPPSPEKISAKQKIQYPVRILDFLVERSNLNPNHCPLGHLWRRFHRK